MDRVECAVVGAGPAGTACALTLARNGVDTVLVERGQYAGEKNVASFVLIADVLEKIIPDFRDDAPLERAGSDAGFLCLREKDFMEFRARMNLYYEHPSIYTAYRSKFDRWFSEKAEAEGVEVIRGVLVTGLLKEAGRVDGIMVGDDELRADVVVGADGIHSVVAREAGLYVDDTSRYMLGVKEVLDLPPETIEERFNLRPGEACVKDGWGYPVSDVGGVFSIYTNNDSVSIVLFAPVDAIREARVNLRERLEDFKAHPYVNALLHGAKLREYESHILADGGRIRMDRLYAAGVLLCGEAGGFNSDMWVGVPPGMLSGIKAAETVAFAKRRRSFDSATLSRYASLLHGTGLPRMLVNARTSSDFMVGPARRHMERFTGNLFDVVETAIIEEVNFIDPEPTSYLKLGYEKLVADYVPVFLKRPLGFIVDRVAKLTVALKMRKVRREA